YTSGIAARPAASRSVTDAHSELRHYLRALRRQAWLIVLVTVLGVVAAGGVTALEQHVYRASMKIVVGQSGGVFQPQFGGAVDPFARTMSDLFKSEVVAEQT